MGNHSDGEKKPIYKKVWFWVVVVIIVAAIGVGGTQDNASQPTTQQASTSTEQQESKEEKNKDVKVTLEQYDKVKNGMTYDEVVEIFGGKETSASESEVAGIKSEVMTWNGNGTFSVVSIGFTDGEVSSKSQTGLE